MYKWEPHFKEDPLKMPSGLKIINLERYLEMLKENDIELTEEQVREYKKSLKK